MKTFELGKTVFFIEDDWDYISVPCDICDGTGDVEIKNQKYDCPECRGKGDFREKGPVEYKIREGVLFCYEVKVSYIGNQYSFTLRIPKFDEDPGFDGEGASRIVDNIFLSREEAEKEVAKLQEEGKVI